MALLLQAFAEAVRDARGPRPPMDRSAKKKLTNVNVNVDNSVIRVLEVNVTHLSSERELTPRYAEETR